MEVIPLRAGVEVLGGPVRDADDLQLEIVVFVCGGFDGSGVCDGAQVGGEEDGGGFGEEAEGRRFSRGWEGESDGLEGLRPAHCVRGFCDIVTSLSVFLRG